MPNYRTYTEEQLIACLREGNHAAFTEIYNRYWMMLADMAYQRLRSHAEAEEAVQEVFVSLYMRCEELVLTSSLGAYLKTALKYKVIDIYRLQQRHYQHLDNLIEAHNIVPSVPDEHVEFKELKEKIISAVNKLSDKCRDVFMMSRFEELSHQEIAERMDISVSTVKKHIHKALQTLRNSFGSNHLNILWMIALIFWG